MFKILYQPNILNFDPNRFVQVAPQSFLPHDESFYSKHISILSVERRIFVPRQKARIPSILEKFLDGRQTKAVGHVASRTHARPPLLLFRSCSERTFTPRQNGKLTSCYSAESLLLCCSRSIRSTVDHHCCKY